MRNVFKNADIFHNFWHDVLGDRPQELNAARNTTGYLGYRQTGPDTALLYSYENAVVHIDRTRRLALWSGDRWRSYDHERRRPMRAFRRHYSDAVDAMPRDAGWLSIDVEDPTAPITEDGVRGIYQRAIDSLLERMLDSVDRSTRGEYIMSANDPERLRGNIAAKVEKFETIAERMGWASRCRADLDDEARARIEQAIEERALAKAEADRRSRLRQRRYFAEVKSGVAAWVRGETNNFPYQARVYSGMPTLLRVRGDTIETSEGASFPVRHAVLAFRRIKKLRDKGEDWQAEGKSIPMGVFSLTGIYRNKDTGRYECRAGCHLLRFEQIAPIARALGVYDV